MPIQLQIKVKNWQALHVRWTHLKFIELVFNVRKLFLMPCIMFLAWDQITLYSSSNITQWKISHNGHITTNNEIAKHFLLDLLMNTMYVWHYQFIQTTRPRERQIPSILYMLIIQIGSLLPCGESIHSIQSFVVHCAPSSYHSCKSPLYHQQMPVEVCLRHRMSAEFGGQPYIPSQEFPQICCTGEYRTMQCQSQKNGI